MPSPVYASNIEINGKVYQLASAAQGARRRTADVRYVPKVQSAFAQQYVEQLDPQNIITWHKGGGASRKVIDGMYSWGENIWGGDPFCLLPGPFVSAIALPGFSANEIPVQGFGEQDGHLYTVCGRWVIRIPGGNPTNPPIIAQDLGAGAVGNSFKRFKGSLFLSTSNTGPMWEKPADPLPWTNTITGGTPVNRTLLGTVFWTTSNGQSPPSTVTAQRLISVIQGPQLNYVAADPRRDLDYTPPAGTPLDTGSWPITGLVSTRDHVYVATTGGLLDLDSSGLMPNLTPGVETTILPTNGRAVLATGGWVYYGAAYGLIRVLVASQNEYASVFPCSPGEGLPWEGPGGGLPMALARHGSWLILAQWDPVANVSYLSFGRDVLDVTYGEETVGGKEIGPVVWQMYPIVLRNLKVTALWTSGFMTSNPILWMAVTDGATPSLRWAPLWVTTPMQDLLQGRPMRFAPSYTLDQSAEDYGDDSLQKNLEEIVCEADNLGTGTNLAVSVALDGSPVQSPIGSLSSAPRARMRPVADVSFFREVTRLTGTGSSVAPPIIRKLSKRVIPNPDMAEIRVYQLVYGRNQTNSANGWMGDDPLIIKAQFEQLQRGNRVSMRDENGQNLTVKLLTVAFQEIEYQSSQSILRVVQLELRVLATGGTTARWNDGTRWGQTAKVWA